MALLVDCPEGWCENTRSARECVRTHEGSFLGNVLTRTIDGSGGLLLVRDISCRRGRFPYCP